MKKLILLFILITSVLHAELNLQIGIPNTTRHYNYNNSYNNDNDILTLEFRRGDTSHSYTAFKNSFGDQSYSINITKYKELNHILEISITGSLMFGYKELYETKNDYKVNDRVYRRDVMTEKTPLYFNGIVPSVMIGVHYKGFNIYASLAFTTLTYTIRLD